MSATAPSSRRRKIAGTVLVAVLAGVLIAIVVVRNAGEKVLNENGETLVLVGKDSPTDSVGLEGVLTDVGGCLGISGDGTETDVGAQVVIWPHGTTIKTPKPLRVTIDGTTYELGDTISTGGNTGSIGRTSYFHDRVPKACRTGKVFIVDNR